MKNVIPLVVAVILGLAAVFAVNRTISKDSGRLERTVEIVAASRVLTAGEVLGEAYISSANTNASYAATNIL